MEIAEVPCVKCNAELREGAKFCSECGATQEKAKCANCQFELAAGAKLVLVCDATYDEHVVVSSDAHVYGGFKCTDWTAEDGEPY